MGVNLKASCRCGTVQATVKDVTPQGGNRLVCHCVDCQTYMHFLEQAALMDEWGGTDIFQTSPVAVRFEAGEESIACVRLSPKGLFRWYAKCCRSPIGNTASYGMPFVGVMRSFLQVAEDGSAAEEAIGPVRLHVQLSEPMAAAIPPERPQGGAAKMFLSFGLFLLRARLRGDHKRSPFYDAETQAPRTEPHVLSLAERETLAAKAV